MKPLIFATAFALLASTAHAQDVYNFYFQKTDHANEMVQVKNGEPVAASKTSTVKSDGTATTTASGGTAPALATSVETPATQTETEPKWRLGFGIAALTDHVKHASSGTYDLLLGYNFNRYFAVEGQAVYGKGYVVSDNYSTDRVDAFGGALGAKLTPVHIDLFGWDFIDIAVNGGVMTTQGSEDDASRTTRLVPYVGGEVAMNLTRNATLALDGKFENGDSKFGQMTFSGIIKF